MIIKEKDKVRFWAKVKRGAPDECWEWQASISNCGYGQFRLNGMKKSHRVSWVIHKGEITDGLCVLHKCDNPCCVNPSHLFLGTHTENMHDMAKKERRGKILTREKVLAILALRGHERQKDIAKKFGISQTMVCVIHSRKNWRYV